MAGAGTLIAVYVCGAGAFSKRAGVFAAAIFALLTPFVYYAKTANPEVPYVFWFAVSLVFYLRFTRTLAAKDVVWFAISAALAICTKDQAYGLYLPVPFVIAYLVWRSNRERRLSHPFLRAVLADRRVGLAALTVVAVCGGLLQAPFQFRGISQSRL